MDFFVRCVDVCGFSAVQDFEHATCKARGNMASTNPDAKKEYGPDVQALYKAGNKIVDDDSMSGTLLDFPETNLEPSISRLNLLEYSETFLNLQEPSETSQNLLLYFGQKDPI